jgi:hypothetical protein
LNLKTAVNTISRRNFLAQLDKNPDLHPIIPLVEMTYSRDSAVNYFDPNDASLLHGTVQFRTRRSSWPAFVQLGDQHPPPRNIGDRCKDSSAIQAFVDEGKYLIKTHFVPSVITLATEELGKVCSRVQPIK